MRLLEFGDVFLNPNYITSIRKINGNNDIFLKSGQYYIAINLVNNVEYKQSSTSEEERDKAYKNLLNFMLTVPS